MPLKNNNGLYNKKYGLLKMVLLKNIHYIVSLMVKFKIRLNPVEKKNEIKIRKMEVNKFFREAGRVKIHQWISGSCYKWSDVLVMA